MIFHSNFTPVGLEKLLQKRIIAFLEIENIQLLSFNDSGQNSSKGDPLKYY